MVSPTCGRTGGRRPKRDHHDIQTWPNQVIRSPGTLPIAVVVSRLAHTDSSEPEPMAGGIVEAAPMVDNGHVPVNSTSPTDMDVPKCTLELGCSVATTSWQEELRVCCAACLGPDGDVAMVRCQAWSIFPSPASFSESSAVWPDLSYC